MARLLCEAAIAVLLSAVLSADTEDSGFLTSIGAHHVEKRAQEGCEDVDLGELIQQHVAVTLERFHRTQGLPVRSVCRADADCITGACDRHARRCVCPSQFHRCGRFCYGYFSLQMTQPEAQAHCHSLGAQLAVPRTHSENTCVYQSIGRGGYFMLFGVNDRAHEGVFVGEDGLGPLDYVNWEPKEPNNRDEKENCVGMYELENGQWNDIPCESRYTHVCQIG